MKNISLLFKAHRINKGLDRNDVAKSLNFSQQFYGRIEKGTVNLPPIYFKKILRVLDIPEKYFVDAMVADLKEHVDKYL